MNIKFVVFGILALGIVGGGLWYRHNTPSSPVTPAPSAASSTVSNSTTTAAPSEPTPQAVTAKKPEPAFSVPGMSWYVDTDFGFSFWYPSGWSVEAQSTSGGYAKGTISKRWMILNKNHQQIFELSALTFNTYTIAIDLEGFPGCSTAYSYEEGWIESLTGCGSKDGNRLYDSLYTMGGLPTLYAQESSLVIRYIVPLRADSAERAVLVSSAPAWESRNALPLARTIMSTNASVAHQEDIGHQFAAVKEEMERYASL
jgi:hypothetical protein